ncbi:MAG TPA: 16S rRNA (guanine(966)-N(2))-methyltransferase RsmD [Flavobacteriales bacterium]
MRIVGGIHKGRRVDPPKTMLARPTTDFAKEGLFNILQHSIPLEGIRVLDLFAGSGNISLEFLSRGAEQVISVEQDATLHAYQQRLAREVNITTQWLHVRSDVFAHLGRSAPGGATFDIVFADPPFHLEGTEKLPALVRERGLLADDGLMIVEHPKDVDMQHDPWFDRTRVYGNVHFSFFKPTPPPKLSVEPA